MRKLFLGRPVFWLLWILLIPPMVIMGRLHLHVSQFNLFISLLLALTAVCVLFIVVSYRKGEDITREPFES